MRPTFFLKGLSIICLFVLLGFVYVTAIRPVQLHWGASAQECAMSMPDDQVVTDPVFDATRAITIHARPEQIYPWLVQMGFDRAGFYGYDLIESLGNRSGIQSARIIMPALQHPKTGDMLPLSVAAELAFGPISPNHFIVWKSLNDPCDGVFIWELVPIDANSTRLISRIRWNYEKTPSGLLLGGFTEFADHVAVRKILEGVRDRAEGHAPESLFYEAFEIVSWCVAAANLIIALVYIVSWRKWLWAWPLALGAGLLFEFVLYGSMPLPLRLALPSLYLFVIVIVWVKFGRYQNAIELIPR